MEAREVTREDLLLSFPTDDVLAKWHRGEDAEWPPLDGPFDEPYFEEEEEEQYPQMPTLRFTVGTKVLCRIGPDAERDWATGLITQLWYREANWPEGSFAPRVKRPSWKSKLHRSKCQSNLVFSFQVWVPLQHSGSNPLQRSSCSTCSNDMTV